MENELVLTTAAAEASFCPEHLLQRQRKNLTQVLFYIFREKNVPDQLQIGQTSRRQALMFNS